MNVNQQDAEIVEDTIYDSGGYVFAFSTPITDEVRDQAIALLCSKLGVSLVSTNATKHGARELVIKEDA